MVECAVSKEVLSGKIGPGFRPSPDLSRPIPTGWPDLGRIRRYAPGILHVIKKRPAQLRELLL